MPTARTRLGQRGEEFARRFLTDKGYQILATNYRCRWGEIDIVAQDGVELVFVEVRTSHGSIFGTPEESLTAGKKRRLQATCSHYLQRYAQTDTNWRIDLVCVRPSHDSSPPQIDHISHAIQL